MLGSTRICRCWDLRGYVGAGIYQKRSPDRSAQKTNLTCEKRRGKKRDLLKVLFCNLCQNVLVFGGSRLSRTRTLGQCSSARQPGASGQHHDGIDMQLCPGNKQPAECRIYQPPASPTSYWCNFGASGQKVPIFSVLMIGDVCCSAFSRTASISGVRERETMAFISSTSVGL